MKQTIINVPKEKRYLSEVFDELPTNCLLDKTITGSGGTTVAINSKFPYVIAVPYVNLIINKQMQNEQILGVYGGVDLDEVVAKANEQISPKIMCTYDSLPRLTELLDTTKYRLLVDESHKLFQDYSFRKDACNGVLDSYKKYSNYTFMTATPMEKTFTLDQLSDMDVIKINWENVDKIKIQSMKCKSVQNAVVDVIKSYLNGTKEGNAYFFINSLKFITTMINKCKLTEDNTRLIYSRNNNKVMPIRNSDTLSLPKKINFITSTAFEGADLFDSEGVIYVVSDGNAEHTLLDIATTIPQIVGRIRDIKSDVVYQIYSNSSVVDITPEEYIKSELEAKETTLKMVELGNQSTKAAKMFNFNLVCYLIKDENGVWHYDENLEKLNFYLYYIRYIYTRMGYLQTRIQSSEKLDLVSYKYNEVKINNGVDNVNKKTFKQYVEEFHLTVSFSTLEEASIKYPFFKDAYYKLGYDKIKELNFSVQAVKRELVKILDTSESYKIIKQFSYVKYQFIPSAKIKSKLQTIYDNMGLNKIAKASDIKQLYRCVERITKIDGKSVSGYVINEPLINK